MAFSISFGRGKQVEIEILFDNRGAIGGEAEGFGADLRRDIGKFDPRAAARDFQLADILHQRLVVLVNRYRNIALRGFIRAWVLLLRERRGGESRCGEQGGGEQAFGHGESPLADNPAGSRNLI